MKKEVIIITVAGFAIGLAEALIYYNMGENKGKKWSYKIPPAPELAKTAGIVLLTAVLTAGLTKAIEAGLKTKPSLVKQTI